MTAILQGDRWLSQVPGLSLWIHAPLAVTDPGGVSHSHHCEYKTSAFRTAQRRRLSPDYFFSRLSDVTTTIPISGLSDAACILVSLSFVLSLLSLHVRFSTAMLVRLWADGNCLRYAPKLTHWIIISNFIRLMAKSQRSEFILTRWMIGYFALN